jgi:hypothetical protein
MRNFQSNSGSSAWWRYFNPGEGLQPIDCAPPVSERLSLRLPISSASSSSKSAVRKTLPGFIIKDPSLN